MTTEDQSKADAAARGPRAPISKSGQALEFGGSTATERHGYKNRSGGRNRAHRAWLRRRHGLGAFAADDSGVSRTRLVQLGSVWLGCPQGERKRRKNMRFCETNSPVNLRIYKGLSRQASKTGRFLCRKNYVTAARRTQLVPLSPLSCALRASARRDAVSALPSRLGFGLCGRQFGSGAGGGEREDDWTAAAYLLAGRLENGENGRVDFNRLPAVN
jgi:hypothetical protein